jgi:hypothetical protein
VPRGGTFVPRAIRSVIPSTTRAMRVGIEFATSVCHGVACLEQPPASTLPLPATQLRVFESVIVGVAVDFGARACRIRVARPGRPTGRRGAFGVGAQHMPHCDAGFFAYQTGPRLRTTRKTCPEGCWIDAELTSTSGHTWHRLGTPSGHIGDLRLIARYRICPFPATS